MIKSIRLELGKYGNNNWVKYIRVHHKNLRYWTTFELERPLFFMLSFLVLIAPELIIGLLIIWFLEKFWGWENFRNHSRFINYIEYENDKLKGE